MRLVERTWKAAQSGYDVPDAERSGDAHYSGKHQLAFDRRQRNIPKLLIPVFESVDRPCLVQRPVDVLESRDECKKSDAKACPKDDYDDRCFDIAGIDEPLDRRIDDPEVQKPRIDISVLVTAENQRPDINHSRKGGGIEKQCHESPQFRGQLVYEPGDGKAEEIADGTGYNGKNKRILYRDNKYFISEKQLCKIFDPDKNRWLQDVEICEAVKYRRYNRNYSKCEKHDRKRQQKQI